MDIIFELLVVIFPWYLWLYKIQNVKIETTPNCKL